ncbi:MAG: nicotinate-nucleotide adenylyltransferase [Paracoccaceae bacterium]|jgi:nicotinate-nucleotide adenylyltransferase|nr:nicotinate-nucleotide adenylyltransferase [Paracoccaceae bacterium]
MRHEIPHARPGQVIGLLGGSFDPAHAGHVHITKVALRRFGLDRVWWLVSPGNPLKARGPAPMADRIARARALIQDPRVIVTDFEARAGTRYTAQTIAALQAAYPGVRFVWLMGADNLVQFHRWQDWQQIMARVPVGVLARPGQNLPARASRAARIFHGRRIKGVASRTLAMAAPPAWCFVNAPLMDISSSSIRARGGWGAALPPHADVGLPAKGQGR